MKSPEVNSTAQVINKKQKAIGSPDIMSSTRPPISNKSRMIGSDSNETPPEMLFYVKLLMVSQTLSVDDGLPLTCRIWKWAFLMN